MLTKSQQNDILNKLKSIENGKQRIAAAKVPPITMIIAWVFKKISFEWEESKMANKKTVKTDNIPNMPDNFINTFSNLYKYA